MNGGAVAPPLPRGEGWGEGESRVDKFIRLYAQPRPQSGRGEIQSHAHFERRQSLTAMDEADRRRRGLIFGEHNLNSPVQDRLRHLIGQDARDAEAGGRAVDRRFGGVDGEARAHGRAEFALRLWIAEDPMLRRRKRIKGHRAQRGEILRPFRDAVGSEIGGTAAHHAAHRADLH